MADSPHRHLEARFALKRTSTDHDAPGVHAPGSYHYIDAPWRDSIEPAAKEAQDYGDSVNSRTKLTTVALFLVGFAKARKLYRGRRIREVYYGRIPYVVKDGRVYRWSTFDPSGSLRKAHMNHLHAAFSN